MIRVVITEERTLIREALANLLTSQGGTVEVVGDAATVEDAVAKVRDNQADVLLIGSASDGGINAARSITAAGLPTRVLILGTGRTVSPARLLAAGAAGYISAESSRQLETEFGIGTAALPGAIKRLLAYGPEAIGDHEVGMAFWTRIWDALRFEERLRAINEGDDAHLPSGVNRSSLDDVLAEAPQEIRFHLSRGAAESFINTAALLHPRGYLQVQDIFLSNIKDYAQGFRGPGKLDGSFVTWVNGAFLHAVGARAGYHVNFAAFPSRAGSKTQILSTTRRD